MIYQQHKISIFSATIGSSKNAITGAALFLTKMLHLLNKLFVIATDKMRNVTFDFLTGYDLFKAFKSESFLWTKFELESKNSFSLEPKV
jgi:hypothetical protein